LDYESEQLNAYDAADAQRYLLGSIKKPEPPSTTPADKAQQFLIDQNLAVPEEDRAETAEGIRRTIGGGIVDAANVGMETGSDLLEAGFFGPTNALANQQLQVKVPPSRLADIPEPEGMIGQLARDFVQFGVGMVMTPGAGAATPLRIAGKSALAEGGYFDPKEGGFIRPLIDLGILPQAVEFLAVESSEEDTVIERLRSRAGLGVQGGALGLAFDGIIGTLRAIKNNPTALRYATNTIATAVGATPLISSDAEGSPIKTLFKRLAKSEVDALTKAATKDGVTDRPLLKRVKDEALRIKNEYPASDGWLPINVNAKGTAPAFKVNKKGIIEIKWEQPSYAFHVSKNKADQAAHKTNLVNKTVDDVNDVLQRAQNGDTAAQEIIGQANWYRTMRTRLRQEFGGLGDVFADILGATSAQTNVQQNYENALQVLRRFTKGEFNQEIDEYIKLIESGEPRGTALYAKDKDPNDPFKLIRKASGELFNTNSAAATEALLDMFRQVKAGGSPKTINFTGNLIGFGNEATIDVWAARYLRDAAGLPRIPPPAEKAVAGKHLTGSTLDDPKIGGEFGFGQEVFSDAANILNQQGGIKSYDPNLGDLGPDDLQAVVWFLEKEKWTKNGWTTKAGEGGSLDYESVYGGSADRARVADLRSRINKKFSPPPKRKAETDDEYADRLQEAKAADVAEREAAKEELATLEGAPQRFTAGVSRERPNQRPTNLEQAELASELTAPLQGDQRVIGYQANNTYGEFMGEAERALNFEVVTQVDFDPADMTKALVEAGRKYDQDAVFVSKIVPAGTPGSRPGVEIYFRDRQGADYAQQITSILRERGIDGFTFVTDARQMDRVDVQATGTEDIGGLVGIRFQYIPEFDDAFDPARADKIFAEKSKEFRKVMNDMENIDGITYADVVHFDTTVFKNTDRSGTEWINGGTSYDEYLGGSATGRAEGVQGSGDIFSSAAP
jgi:hypothetical protein